MKPKLKNKLIWHLLACFLAGCTLPFAFAPYNIFPLAIIAPAILLFFLLRVTPLHAFFYGFVFGVGYFTVGISWVYISIHLFGNADAILSTTITGLLIIALSLFIACMSYLFARIPPKNTLVKCLVTFPFIWVLFEIVRTLLFTGFPWLLLGYSQIDTPLRGLAPIVSVYGISFAVALTSGALVSLLHFKNRKNWKTWRTWRPRIITIFAIAVLWAGSAYLATIQWTHPIGKPLRVSLIQGNIPQSLKWEPDHVQNILMRYRDLTATHWSSDIIVWPEAAVPIPKQTAQTFLHMISRHAKWHHSTVITGIPIYDVPNQRQYNGMIALGNGNGTYKKRHLVPFGEYFPMRTLLKTLIDYLAIPMSNLQAGARHQTPLTANGINIAPYICYEIAYPNEAVDFLPKANLLVTIVDDSWFGKSIAAEQQLQISQMRSLETGRYQLISTNNGITAIITPQGKVQSRAPAFQTYVLTDDVQAMAGATPWVKMNSP